MKKRLFAVMAAIMLAAGLCSCSKENDNADGVESNDIVGESGLTSLQPGDDATQISWNDAAGAYVTDKNDIILTLVDASDDLNAYYNVEFYDSVNDITLISVEDCGDITEDEVLRVNVSENDLITLSIVDTDNGMRCIEVSGTYNGAEFEGNGTYYIAAG